jgi:hypothetical protein
VAATPVSLLNSPPFSADEDHREWDYRLSTLATDREVLVQSYLQTLLQRQSARDQLLYLSWSDPQTHRPLCNWYYWWVTKETRANQVGQKSKLHLTAQSSEVPEQLTVLATSLDSVWQEMGQNGRPKLLKGATASNATGKDLANKFL